MRAARFELATFDGIRAIARLIALAAAIVPSVAYADPATVVINGFTIGANAAPGAFVFAPLNTMGQAWSLYAQAGAGAPQSTSGSVADWGNVNATAATLTSMASVSTLQATDPLTQLPTPMFTLAAFVAGANNWAAGTMASFGSFCFGDGTSFDGTSAGCNVAGELTFTVYYDLIVGSIPGESYAGAALQVANGDGSISALLSDFASPEAGGSRFDQFFTFTLLLGAGESASFDLSGTVRAGTVAAQVPEPNALALLTLGLLALAAARRRRRR